MTHRVIELHAPPNCQKQIKNLVPRPSSIKAEYDHSIIAEHLDNKFMQILVGFYQNFGKHQVKFSLATYLINSSDFQSYFE